MEGPEKRAQNGSLSCVPGEGFLSKEAGRLEEAQEIREGGGELWEGTLLSKRCHPREPQAFF